MIFVPEPFFLAFERLVATGGIGHDRDQPAFPFHELEFQRGRTAAADSVADGSPLQPRHGAAGDDGVWQHGDPAQGCDRLLQQLWLAECSPPVGR